MPKGILLDDEFDLKFADGGLVIGEVNQQNIALLLLSTKGDAKDYPDRGVGMINFINADDTIGLISESRVQLTMDGAKVKTVKYQDGQLKIDAQY